jgi:hypothetical protein
MTKEENLTGQLKAMLHDTCQGCIGQDAIQMEVRGCTMPEAVPHGVRALATNLSSQIRFRAAKDSNTLHVLLIYFCQWNERSLA